jgi:hypothetical protein
MIELSIV